ncbi:MAG: hypothetical protein DWQ07_15445 [Chloroflexi bacterium]|nr:MAG: hypothetical protein DWQ07_15445 [Chloroflexota bacterium]
MNEPSGDYYAYLLRLFRVVEHGQPVWRVSLQEPGSEQSQKFASVQEFVEFLMSITHQANSYSIHHQLLETSVSEDTSIAIKLIISSSQWEE